MGQQWTMILILSYSHGYFSVFHHAHNLSKSRLFVLSEQKSKLKHVLFTVIEENQKIFKFERLEPVNICLFHGKQDSHNYLILKINWLTNYFKKYFSPKENEQLEHSFSICDCEQFCHQTETTKAFLWIWKASLHLTNLNFAKQLLNNEINNVLYCVSVCKYRVEVSCKQTALWDWNRI